MVVVDGTDFMPNVSSQTRRGAAPELSVMLWIGFRVFFMTM
jgi:hypothetical protein